MGTASSGQEPTSKDKVFVVRRARQPKTTQKGTRSMQTSNGMGIQTTKGTGIQTSKGLGIQTSKGTGIKTSNGLRLDDKHDYAYINEYERYRDYFKWDTSVMQARRRREEREAQQKKESPRPEPQPQPKPVVQVEEPVEEEKEEEVVPEDESDGKMEETVTPSPVLLTPAKPARLLSPLPSALGSIKRMLTMFSNDTSLQDSDF